MKGGSKSKTALDQTASMSPDERARRGLTPPTPPSGDRAAAGAVEAPNGALGETEVASGSGQSGTAPVAIDLSGLPVDDTGRYELSGVHARGGLGRIVKARDHRLHRTVAIKELLQRTPTTEARFVREALITARLEHPGIVPVHEAGRWPSGDPYYSMKLVSGRTLKELIQAGSSLEERLALVPHVLAVAEAIAYAHSQRIIHRDIKPANVIVGDFGETVVVDWGLAKDLSGLLPEADEGGGPVTGAPGTTAAGNIMGTPSYMSPEQARGEDLDERADVYSLGAMLFEVLVGEPPHTGDSAAQILDSALAGLPSPIERYQPHAPADLVAVARKAMARSREARYPSAVELAEDIRRFQTGQLVTARSYSTRTRVARWIGRHRGMVAVASAATLALIATGAFAFQRVVRERNFAQSEQAAAEGAEREARRRSNELTFLQARSSLLRDPTATVAWLKEYPSGGPHAAQLGALMDEASALGVASHVVRLESWVMGAGYASDGSLVSAELEGRVVKWDLASGKGKVIGTHGEEVWTGRVSPDGSRIAVGGQGGAVALYPLTGSGEVLELGGHHDMIDRLDFAADGKRLLTWSKGKAIRVWDLASAAAVISFDADVASGAIEPGGEAAFIGLSSGEIVRVAVGGGRTRVARFDKPAEHLYASPTGDRLLAHSADGTLRLIDIATGKARVLGSQPADKGTAAFSRDGALVASGGTDSIVNLWSTTGTSHKVLRGHEDSIYQVEFAPDASFLASASDDGTARIWDLRTGQSQVLRGHDDDVFALAVRPDGKELVTASLDSSFRVWPVGDGARVLFGAGSMLDRVGFEGDGAAVYSAGKDRVLRRWDLATGERTDRTIPEVSKKSKAYPMADPQLRRVAFPRDDGAIDVWELATETTRTLRGGHEGRVSVALSQDAGWMVSSDKKGLTLLWKLSAGEPPRVLFRDRTLAAIGLSNDGAILAAREGSRLVTFDLASGAERTSIDAKDSAEAGVETPFLLFSPDGNYLLGTSKGGTSLLWKLAEGTVHSFGRAGYHVMSTEFSPDSRRLAASMSDRTVISWNLETMRTEILKGHRDLVYRVAYSPDGETLASSSYDRTVRLWNGHTGRPLRVLRGHTGAVTGIAFSPDGGLLASGSFDGTVRLWDLSALPSAEPDRVRARLTAATSARIDSDLAATPLRIAE